MRVFVLMREMMTYMLFIFWVGGSGFLFVLLGDDVYVLAHLCSKCLQTWTLWLYSSFLPVTAGGTAYQDTWPHGLPCPSHEGTQSCNFLFWVLFWDLTRVYLFENKICDSVMILMCLLFCFNESVALKMITTAFLFYFIYFFLELRFRRGQETWD